MGTTVIHTDPVTNDLVFINGLLTMVSGVQGVTEICKAKCEAQLREMVLNMGNGMPTFDDVFQGDNLIGYCAAGIERLLTVTDVVSVPSFNAYKSGQSVVYNAQILSAYSDTLIVISNQGILVNE